MSEYVGETRHNIGLLYLYTCRQAHAILLLKAALVTAWQDHSESVDTKYYLATAYQIEESYAESKKYYTAVLSQYAKSVPENHEKINQIKKQLQELDTKIKEQKNNVTTNADLPKATNSTTNQTRKIRYMQCHQHFRAKKNHIHSHAKEKAFQCLICSKKFNRNIDLKTHMHIHSQEKKLTCPICYKNFSLKKHMKRHLKTHIENNPFICKICHKTCAKEKEIKEHIRLAHPIDHLYD